MFLQWSSTKGGQAIMIHKKHGASGVVGYRKLWKSSCQKPQDRFQYYLAGMFLWWPSTKIVQAVMICQKTWLPGGLDLFSLYICVENFKKFLVRNHQTNFNITWQQCSFGDPVPRLFKPSWFIEKNGRQGAMAYFPYIAIYILYSYIKKLLVRNLWTKIVQSVMIHEKNIAARDRAYFPYIVNFKNLLVRNQRTNFNIIWQKCSHGDPLPRFFKPSWFIKKLGLQGRGLLSLYIYIENFKTLLLVETTGLISI